MFEQQDKGFGMGKWVYWFFGLFAVYGVSTLFPKGSWIARAGLFLAWIGIGVGRMQFRKINK